MISRPAIPAQTALRGVAALVVFIAHAEFFALFPQFPLLKKVFGVFLWHNVAVDLFFELSGFILCYVYLKRQFEWKVYARARFARIYPLYILAFTVMISMSVLAWLKSGVFSAEIESKAIIPNLLLVQAWPFVHRFHSIVPPTWSISVEVFLYIFLFPLLCSIQKYLRLGPKMALSIIPVSILAVVYNMDSNAWNSVETSALTPWRGILCFTSGFFVCDIGLEQGFRGISRSAEICLVLLVISSLLFEFPCGRGYSVLGFPFLAYFSAISNSFISTCLNFRFLELIGDLSYSIYVWHWPMIKAISLACGLRRLGHASVDQFQPSPGRALMYILLLISAVTFVSYCSYFYFEKPLGSWIRETKIRKSAK